MIGFAVIFILFVREFKGKDVHGYLFLAGLTGLYGIDVYFLDLIVCHGKTAHRDAISMNTDITPEMGGFAFKLI